MIVVKGTRAHAEAVREGCREFLEGELKLTLNMEKTHITHVNDGFVFLGHRVIRKRGPWPHAACDDNSVGEISGLCREAGQATVR